MQGTGVDCSFSAKLYAIISHNVNFVELVRTCLSEKKKLSTVICLPPPPPAQFKPSTVETNYVVNSHAYPLRSSSKKNFGFDAAIFFCQVISEVAFKPYRKRVVYNHA